MRRVLATAAVLALTLGGATACGNDEGTDGDSGTKTIEITFANGSVTPNGERVKAKVGQPIELVVKADEAGEIHVHSTPEQELEYKAGQSTVTIDGIDQPGTVDVESHHLDKVIVQLEVH